MSPTGFLLIVLFIAFAPNNSHHAKCSRYRIQGWKSSHPLILEFCQQVRYLKIIEKSGYQALPWVRYITQNGGGSRVLK